MKHDGGRHLLFRKADDLCVDLRLGARCLQPVAVAVHGQLADRRYLLKGRGGSAVLLMDGRASGRLDVRRSQR